ncbi:RHS repeat protein, partial [Chloroflexia bacterium SDU3-3]
MFTLHPVNTFTGSLYERFTDLSVPTSGQSLTLSRSYSSLLTQPALLADGMLSPGWRHNFDERLTFADQPGGEAGMVIYETASSSRLRFLDNGDDTFTPLPDVYATLARQGSSYVVALRDRSTATFSADGLLTKRTDAQGRDQNLTYATGRLDRVTDAASGRFLSFAYTEAAGQQRLHTVTDSAGRSITYGYSDTGDLSTVTDLRGGITTYTYSNGSVPSDDRHLLTGIIDPLGIPQLTNIYDQRHRVKLQRLANGQRTIFTYRHGAADGAASTVWDTEVATASGQPPAKITAEPAAEASRSTRMSFAAKTVYFPLIMQDETAIPADADIQIDHYRLDGTLEYQERGGQITSYVTYDASGTPTTIVDGAMVNDVPLATTVSNNRVGQPLQVVNASGHTTTATYRSDNQISTFRGADSILNSATYDARGNLAAVMQIANSAMRLTTAYTYTTDNRVQEVKDAAGIRTRYAYDTLGQLTDVTVGYGT